MSIPLDRLYHYIDSIAEEINDGSVLIYRFYPHGSKNLKDLTQIYKSDYTRFNLSPQIFCYDQEPLDYERYVDSDPLLRADPELVKILARHSALPKPSNIRYGTGNIFDRAILLHSEQRSTNAQLYADNGFIPVYYWSHAIIALDWFRFARHVEIKKSPIKTFLIYNRAWSGTREYRLKFADYVIRLGLVNECQMRVSPIDSELGNHYELHNFKNKTWRPGNVIENFFPTTSATSSYSADFDEEDYELTDIEVVLETLFDDARLHLTEKILRPIALGQPFILAGTHLSLKYLRDYGFKTFGHIWDERYDECIDPEERLMRIVDLMRDITNWTPATRERKLAQAQAIADYNRKHFFSQEFFNCVINELKDNLSTSLNLLKVTNTGRRYLDRVDLTENIEELQTYLNTTANNGDIITAEMRQVVDNTAREYYLRTLSAHK